MTEREQWEAIAKKHGQTMDDLEYQLHLRQGETVGLVFCQLDPLYQDIITLARELGRVQYRTETKGEWVTLTRTNTPPDKGRCYRVHPDYSIPEAPKEPEWFYGERRGGVSRCYSCPNSKFNGWEFIPFLTFPGWQFMGWTEAEGYEACWHMPWKRGERVEILPYAVWKRTA